MTGMRSSPPDPSAADHAATELRSTAKTRRDFYGLVAVQPDLLLTTAELVDALVARCEQLERERDEATAGWERCLDEMAEPIWTRERIQMERAEVAERRVAELEAALRGLEQALDSMLWDGVPFTDWSANVDSARRVARAALEGGGNTAFCSGIYAVDPRDGMADCNICGVTGPKGGYCKQMVIP